MSARGFIGSGDLYVARYDTVAGAFGPMIGPIETTKFEITPKTETKEMVSKGRDTYGQVIETVTLGQPFEFTVEFAEVTGDTLVNAFLGTSTVINQAAGSLVDVDVVARLGGHVEVGFLNLVEAGFTVENSGGTVTYVLGTDYSVNYRLGTIKALEGGAITDEQTVVVNGTYTTATGTDIAGGTQAEIRAKFFLDGKNQAGGASVHVTVHEAVVAADSAFDFLADDFNSVSLPGKLKTPVGMTQPFNVKFFD